jgi:hypothetical protein
VHKGGNMPNISDQLNALGAKTITPDPVQPVENTAQQLSGMGATPMQGTGSMQQQVQPTIGQQAGQMGAAVVGGLANTGANVLQTVNNAAVRTNQFLHLISAKDAQDDIEGFNKFLEKGRTSSVGNQSDVFNRAAQEYPGLHTAAQYGSGAATLAALPAAPGILSRAATNAGLGATLASGDNADDTGAATLGAALGAGGSLAGEAISKGANILNKAFTWYKNPTPGFDISADLRPQAVQAEANMTAQALAKSNENWNTIKAIPGTINGAALSNRMQDFIHNQNINLGQLTGQATPSVSGLNQSQISVLAGLQNKAVSLQNMDDAIKLKQEMSKQYSSFTGRGISDSIAQGYKDLQNNIDQQIQDKAAGEGKLQEYLDANSFHKNVIVPLQDAGSMDRLKAIQGLKQTQDYNQQIAAKNQQLQQAAQQSGNTAQQIQPAPISPAYTNALRQIFPQEPTPAKVQSLLSRLDPEGQKTVEKQFLADQFKGINDIDPSKMTAGPLNTLIKKANTIQQQYKGVISPEAMKTVVGLKNSMLAARSITGFKNEVGGAAPFIGGALVGGGVGYQQGGAHDAALGMAMGALGGKALYSGLGSALTSGAGQLFIKKATSPEIAKQLINAAARGPSALSNNNQGE